MGVVPPRRIAPAIAVVIALHSLVVWWGFPQQAHTGAPHASAPVMLTRWFAAPAPPAELRVPPSPAAAPTRVTAPRVRRAALPAHEGAAPLSDPAPPESALPAAPEPPLRTDGIQRAARESAQRKGLAELANEQLGQQPVGAQAALRDGMPSAAHSDCLKGGEGGYAHAGLGLLALPLLAYDAATGRCR